MPTFGKGGVGHQQGQRLRSSVNFNGEEHGLDSRGSSCPDHSVDILTRFILKIDGEVQKEY